ncbi:MAG: hypothetical protein RBS39_06710 [Phycisphaerales bacterium]|jgi:hypothetical protein|nr:hypothetical protein [Phycisphaerales bacterium]
MASDARNQGGATRDGRLAEVRRVVARAERRLLVADLLRTLAVTLSAAVGGLIVLRLVQQVAGMAVAWREVAIGAGAAAVVCAVVWSVVRRARGVDVARRVDEGANLRETLSTAMCVSGDGSAWSRAIVEDARKAAVGVKVREAVPIGAPRLWPMPFGLGLALAIVWLSVPRVDLSGVLAKKDREQREEAALVEVKAEAEANEQKLAEALSKAGLDEGLGQEAEPEVPEPKTAEEVQRAALKRLTNVADALREKRDTEVGPRAEAMQELMRQLKTPGPGPLQELSRSMARGEFEKAQAELKKLADQMASGEMTAEQKEQMQAQLDALAKQLEQLSQNADKLAEALENAGMSAEQAQQMAQQAMSNPEALQKALESMPNMSAAQKQALQQMAQSQCEACENASNMSSAMSQMAQGMSSQGMSQSGASAMSELSEQLSAAEMAQMELASLEAAMSECNAQMTSLGQKMGSASWAQCNNPGDSAAQAAGNSAGGRKAGVGGTPNLEGNAGVDTDFGIEERKAGTQTRQGPIIATTVVEGMQVKGESRAAFAEAVETGASAAAEAVSTMQVPREYQDSVKRYFGRLEREAKKDKKD